MTEKFFSFVDLSPFTVESDEMQTVTMDGEEVPFEQENLMFIGQSAMSGRSVLVVTGLEGHVRDIEVTNNDYTATIITEVFDTGVYASLPWDAFDPSLAERGSHLGFHDSIGGSEDGDGPLNRLLTETLEGNNTRHLQSSCSTYRNFQLALAFDSSFCSQFGGFSQAKAEVEKIVAFASTRFFRLPGLCVNLQIVHLEGYCSSSSDPYYKGDFPSGCNGRGMLHEFQDFWNSNRNSVHRDAAHLFRNKLFSPDQGVAGCAYVDTLCDLKSAYGVNDVTTYRDLGGRAYLFAHELGHTAGAHHSDGGLMSSGNTDAFSQTSKNRINDRISKTSCVGTLVSSGSYKQIKMTKYSNMCLDVYHNGKDDNTPVIVYPCHDGDNLQWAMDSQGRIHPKSVPTKCLEGGRPQDKDRGYGTLYSKLFIYTCHDGTHQKWSKLADGRLKNQGTGYYMGTAYCSSDSLSKAEFRNYDSGHCGEVQKWIW